MTHDSQWTFPVSPGMKGAGTVVIVEPMAIPPERWAELLMLGTEFWDTGWVVCSALPRDELHAAMLPFWQQFFAQFRLEGEAGSQIHLLMYYGPNGFMSTHGFTDGQELPRIAEDPFFELYPGLSQGGFVSVYPGEYWVACGMVGNNIATANWAPLMTQLLSGGVFSEGFNLDWFKSFAASQGFHGGLCCINKRLVLAEPAIQPPGYALTGFRLKTRS